MIFINFETADGAESGVSVRKQQSPCGAYLVSDESRAELLAFGREIGLKEQFLKSSGDVYEHFRVTRTVGELALKFGASPVSRAELRAASHRRARKAVAR